LPLALLSIIGVIHFKIDTVILSLMKGLTDVGIYGVPFKILEIATVIPAIFIGNVFPILTRYYHANDDRINGAIQKSFDFLVILAIPIMVWLMMLARPIIDLIAGREYITASTVNFFNYAITAPLILVILAFYVAVSFLLYIFSNILTVVNRQASQIVPMVIITGVNLALNIILVPRYSYLASAIIACITVVIMFVWWIILSHRYLSFRLAFKVVPRALAAGLVMGVGLYFLRDLNVILVSLAGFLIYFAAGYLVGLFSRQMIKSLLPSLGSDHES